MRYRKIKPMTMVTLHAAVLDSSKIIWVAKDKVYWALSIIHSPSIRNKMELRTFYIFPILSRIKRTHIQNRKTNTNYQCMIFKTATYYIEAAILSCRKTSIDANTLTPLHIMFQYSNNQNKSHYYYIWKKLEITINA